MLASNELNSLELPQALIELINRKFLW